MYIVTATRKYQTLTLCTCRTKAQARRAIKKYQSRRRDHHNGPEVFKMEKIYWFSTLNFIEFLHKVVRRINNKRYLRMVRRRDRLNRRIKNYTLIK